MNIPLPKPEPADEPKVLTEAEQKKQEMHATHGIWALSIMLFNKAPHLSYGDSAQLKMIGHFLMESINDYEITMNQFEEEYNREIQMLNTYLVKTVNNNVEIAEKLSKIICLHLDKMPIHPSIDEGILTYKAIIDDCLATFAPFISQKKSIIIDTQKDITDTLEQTA